MPWYLIKTTNGQVVLRQAIDSSRGPVLHPSDQEFANEVVMEVQAACAWFYMVDPPPYPGCPEIEGLSDDEVRARIKALDRGENTREADRTKQARYPLAVMPLPRQRALIERIERIKARWQFRKLTDEEAAALGAPIGQPPRGHYPWYPTPPEPPAPAEDPWGGPYAYG